MLTQLHGLETINFEGVITKALVDDVQAKLTNRKKSAWSSYMPRSFQKIITGMFQFYFPGPTIFKVAFFRRFCGGHSVDLVIDLRLLRFRYILCDSEVTKCTNSQEEVQWVYSS